MTNLSKYELLGKRRLDQLDGLRGACAIAVLIHHMIQTSQLGVLEGFIPSVLLETITVLGILELAYFLFFQDLL